MRQINRHLHGPLLASHITAIEKIQIGSARCLKSMYIGFPLNLAIRLQLVPLSSLAVSDDATYRGSTVEYIPSL